MKEETKQYVRQLVKASTVGFSVAFAIFIGVGIGFFLDTRFGTWPWLTIVFMIFGIVAGFKNYYRFAKKQQREEEGRKKYY